MGEFDVIGVLNVAGLFVFAVSGALTALRNDMDVFGVAMVAFVTSVGGGTIRDVLLGSFPVWWVREPGAILIAVIGAAVATIAQPILTSRLKALIWADAMGLAMFTVIGAQAALAVGASAAIAIFMGAVTATFGGVVRDVLLNEAPLILKQEIYATAALIGASSYVGLQWIGLGQGIAAIFAAAITFGVRAVAILFNVPSPKFGRPRKAEL